jgi:conjugative transfer region protein (TIGR03750 family)
VEDESEYTDAYVPKFLNEEPVVMMGLTEVELVFSLGLGFFFGGLIPCAFAAAMGAGIFSFIVFVFGMGLVSFVTLKFIAGLKIGKPRGFLKSKIKVLGSGLFPGFFNAKKLYIKDEPMTIGRSKRYLIIREDN